MKSKRTLGEFISAYRSFCGVGQKDFSKTLNVSQATICKWEKGILEPSIDSFFKLVRLIGCDINRAYDEHIIFFNKNERVQAQKLARDLRLNSAIETARYQKIISNRTLSRDRSTKYLPITTLIDLYEKALKEGEKEKFLAKFKEGPLPTPLLFLPQILIEENALIRTLELFDYELLRSLKVA